MKQLFFATALLSGALVFSAEQSPSVETTAAQQCPPQASSVPNTPMEKGQAYVCLNNNSGETISVEWAVMLSPHKRSTGSFYAYPDDANPMQKDKLNWMVDAEEAANYPVYNIEVRVKEGRGGKLLAEKKMTRTLGPKALTGKNPANLMIRYDGKCRVSAYVDN